MYLWGTTSNVIQSRGTLSVSSGAVLCSSLVRELTAVSGVTLNDVTVTNGTMIVLEGAVGNNITVGSQATLDVSSGAVIDGLSFEQSENIYQAKFTVSSGATVLNIAENGHWIEVQDGATVSFAPTSIDNLVLGQGQRSATVHSGTIANGVTIQDGFLQVYNGGVAKDVAITSLGRISGLSGGVASGITMSAYGSIDVSDGGVVSAVSILKDIRLFVSSGGTVDGLSFGERRNYTVSSGTTVLNIEENGNWIEVQDGATATFASHTIEGLTVNPNSSATVHSGTTVNGVTISGNGKLVVYSGGMASGVSMTGNSNLTVSSGGIIDGLYLDSAGSYTISSGATALNIVENGCWIEVQDGAVVTFAEQPCDSLILSGWGRSASVHSGTTMNHVTLNSNTLLAVYDGGVVSDVTVSRGAAFTVSSCGSALDVLENGGWVEIADGASATFRSHVIENFDWSGSGTVHSGTTVLRGNLRANVHVFSGGLVDEANLNGNGTLYLSGGTARATKVSWGTIMVSSGGRAYDTDLSGGTIIVCDGGLASNTEFVYNEALVIASSGGVVLDTIVSNSGKIVVSEGGLASGTFVENGTLIVYDGGLAVGAVVSCGDYRYDKIIVSGGEVRDVQVVKGTLYMYETTSGSGITIEDGGHAVFQGAAFDDVLIHSGGSLYVCNPVSGRNITLEKGGSLNGFVFDSQVVFSSGIHISSYVLTGSAALDSGMKGTDITVGRGGTLSICDGTSAERVVVSSGGSLRYESGLNATDVDIWIKDGAKVNGIIVETDIRLESMKDMVISSGFVIATSQAAVYSGQTACDVIVNNGKLTISSGGTAYRTVVSSGGRVSVESGCVVDGVFIFSGGQIDIADLSSVRNLTIASGANLNGFILNEERVFDTFDQLYISGGTAGYMSSWMPGWLYVNLSSGQTVSDTVVEQLTHLRLYDGAYAEKTFVSAAMTINSGGSATDVIVSFGASLAISGGGSATDVIIHSGASVTVGFNGLLDSVILNNGGYLHVGGYSDADFGTVSILYNPWQGVVRTNSEPGSAITYLERDANIYYGGIDSGFIRKADSFDLLNIMPGNSAIVYSGGVMNSAYVCPDGLLLVQSGGTASVLFAPWSGTVEAEEGASVTMLERDANVYYGRKETGIIRKADSMEGITVGPGENVIVYENGFVSDFSVRNEGFLSIESGGSADHVIVNTTGQMNVSDGAEVTIDFNPWNGVVSAGEKADVTYIERDANVYHGDMKSGFIQKADTFDSLEIASGEHVVVYEGGIVRDTIINDSGLIEILSGGTAEIAFNPWSGSMFVAEGGTITHLDREFNVYYGGSSSGLLSRSDEIDGLEIISGNTAIVYSGGLLRDMTGYYSGGLVLSSGGMIENAILFGNHQSHNSYYTPTLVMKGGIMTSVTILDGYQMRAEGMVYDITISNGTSSGYSFLGVGSSGFARNVTVGRFGQLDVRDSATARDIVVSRGNLRVGESAVVSNVLIQMAGQLEAFGSASVHDLTVSSGGRMNISGTVTLNNAEIREGAFVNGLSF